MELDRAVYDQTGFDIRFEWGPTGAQLLSATANVMVIVDVLSFTTAVEVAVTRGATVIPVRWKDDHAVADAVAEGAVHAVPLRQRSPDRPWSLAPSSLLDVPPGTRLAMPSPNGATITQAIASGGATILAGCLRNASAVARAARTLGHTVAVIAAGERWPDGSLRPAYEDLLASGTILARLASLGAGTLSPEARIAIAAADGSEARSLLRDCASARELIAKGYPGDIDLAAELDVSETVPVLRHGEFDRLALDGP